MICIGGGGGGSGGAAFVTPGVGSGGCGGAGYVLANGGGQAHWSYPASMLPVVKPCEYCRTSTADTGHCPNCGAPK